MLKPIFFLLVLLSELAFSQAVPSPMNIVDYARNAAAGRGVTQGWLVEGASLSLIKKQTKSDKPVKVVATQIASASQQPECGRIRIAITQDDVPTLQGTRITYTFGWDMNLCANGLAPQAAKK